MFWIELEVGPPCFHLEKSCEIRIAQLVADHVEDDLVHESRHRHGNVELAARLEPELEILAEQVAGECRREIEVHESRRLVAREDGAHNASIEKLEVVGPCD